MGARHSGVPPPRLRRSQIYSPESQVTAGRSSDSCSPTSIRRVAGDLTVEFCEGRYKLVYTLVPDEAAYEYEGEHTLLAYLCRGIHDFRKGGSNLSRSMPRTFPWPSALRGLAVMR